MPEHDLKIWPSFFKAIQEGRKTFEVRKADRDFDVGDILVLKEWDPDIEKRTLSKQLAFTGRELRVRVTYLMRGGTFGIAVDRVVMGIKPEAIAFAESEKQP